MDLPPLDWLLGVSDNTLMDLQMASLNRGAKHLKSAKVEWNEAVKHMATAELAQYLREHRDEMREIILRNEAQQGVISFPERKRA